MSSQHKIMGFHTVVDAILLLKFTFQVAFRSLRPESLNDSPEVADYKTLIVSYMCTFLPTVVYLKTNNLDTYIQKT